MVTTLQTCARLLEEKHSRWEYILAFLVDGYTSAQEPIKQSSSTGARVFLHSSQRWSSIFFSINTSEGDSPHIFFSSSWIVGEWLAKVICI